MNQPLDIYLVRHTQPLIEAGTCYGQLDCDVSGDYALQLEGIIDYFKHKKISAIYSSPLLRCALLAEDLAKQHISDPVIYKQGLKEINFGEWEGVKWNDIAQYEIEQWNNNRLHFQFPNGETPLQFHSRVIKCWSEEIESLAKTTSPQSIVVIAHAGVIRSILCDCLAIPFQHSTRLKIDYASISMLRVQQYGVECHLVNRMLNP